MSDDDSENTDKKGRLVIELKGVDKRHLVHVWQKMKNGQELEGAESYIGQSMADHPFWFPFFETMDVLGGDDTLPDGSNPFAHVSLHVLIGSQIFHQSPKEAEIFYRMRLRKGDDSHDIIHMMIAVFQRHLRWTVEHREETGGQFDTDAYAKTLKSLWGLKTKKLWRKLGYPHVPKAHARELSQQR